MRPQPTIRKPVYIPTDLQLPRLRISAPVQICADLQQQNIHIPAQNRHSADLHTSAGYADLQECQKQRSAAL